MLALPANCIADPAFVPHEKTFSHLTWRLVKAFLRSLQKEDVLNISGGKRGRITIHEVAAAAAVSISTASKALNDTGRMGSETRERVKRIAAEIGYRPNALARGLLSKRSFTIGLLTNDTYGRFTLPVMAGISDALVDHGVSVFLCAIEDDPALAQIHVDAMLDKQVDGIIATGKRLDRRLPVDLSNLHVPVVYAFTEGTQNSVTFRSDDEQGARLAVEWLANIGRRRIAHITGRKSSSRCGSVPAPITRWQVTASQCSTASGRKAGAMTQSSSFGRDPEKNRMRSSAAMIRSPEVLWMPCASAASRCRRTSRSSASTIGRLSRPRRGRR